MSKHNCNLATVNFCIYQSHFFFPAISQQSWLIYSLTAISSTAEYLTRITKCNVIHWKNKFYSWTFSRYDHNFIQSRASVVIWFIMEIYHNISFVKNKLDYSFDSSLLLFHNKHETAASPWILKQFHVYLKLLNELWNY